MPSIISLASLIGAIGIALTSAGPTLRATCPTTFPSSFKIKEGSGYFEFQDGAILSDKPPATASYFYINNIYYEGDNSVSQLSYSHNGATHGAWVEDSTSGFILFRPTSATGFASSDLPIEASLEPDCTVSLTLWEAHADSILQVCDGLIYLATSQKSGCMVVTASLVQ